MIAKSTKNKLWIALAVALVVLFGYVKISSYFANKPIEEGVDLVSGKLIDFTTAGELSKPYSILFGYAREVRKMTSTKERKAFIEQTKEYSEDGIVSVKEWNDANDKFQKILDEYELEEAKKLRKKRSYLNQ